MSIRFIYGGNTDGAAVNGSDEDEFFVSYVVTQGGYYNYIWAFGGDDWVLANESDALMQTSATLNDSIANAVDLSALTHLWSTTGNSLFGDSTVPHLTAVVETTVGQSEFFAVVIGAGQQITVDIDFGSNTPIGNPRDLVVEIQDGLGNILATADDSHPDDGGLGSFLAPGSEVSADPYLAFTAASAGTYYINVRPSDGGPGATFTDNYSFVLNLSNTGTVGRSNSVRGSMIDGGAGDDALFGSAGGDSIWGREGNDLIHGEAGFDRLEGNDGNDVIYGGDGNDFLLGGAGNDVLDGGAGSDWAEYAEKVAAVSVTLNGGSAVSVTVGGVVEDTIRNIENILGGSGNDILIGDSLGNALYGGHGNDTLKGGAGNDVLDGGYDVDWADYSDKQAAVSLTLNGATDTFATVGGITEDRVRNVENIQGGSGDDVLVGDGLANELFGGSGNDVLRGGGGKDVLDGGAGSDLADYSDKTAAVTVVFNAGNAIVTVGGVVEDTLRNIEIVQGGSGDDLLVGDGQPKVLRGGAGNDILRGGALQDTLDGGAGLGDWADYSHRADSVSVTLNGSTEAVVTVNGPFVEDRLRNIENVRGGSRADSLIGDGLANELDGFGGNDVLSGRDGNDKLTGGAGDDLLYGGAGQDTAFFSGNYAQYSIVVSGQKATLVGPDGTDVVSDVETFVFNDRSAAITGAVRNDDFSGDSKADILWRHDTGATYLWNSTAAAGGSFTVQNIGGVGNDWQVQDTADFNGDGKADILWRHDTGATYLWNSTAAVGGGFTVQDIGGLGNDWQVQDAGDFNGDGKADLLWRHDTGATYLWNSTAAAGVGFTVQDVGGVGNDWRVQDTADFNGDGKADILWRHDTGAIYLWNSTAVAGVGFTVQDIGGVGNDWKIQNTADFNGDGKADILWRNDNGAAALWNSTPAAGVGFTFQDIGGVGNDWRVQAAADFNGDSKADILWRHDTGATYLWNSTAAAGGSFTVQDIGGLGNDWQVQV